MLWPWLKEGELCNKFQEILVKHYDIQLYAATIGSTTCRTDGHISVGKFIYAMCEGKLWKGSGDAEVQVRAYVLDTIWAVFNNGDPLDLFPCIIIYFVGECI